MDLKELTNRVKELLGGKRGGGTQPSNQTAGDAQPGMGGTQPAGSGASGASYSGETGSSATGADQSGVAGTQPDAQDQGVSADGQEAGDSDVGDPGTEQTP